MANATSSLQQLDQIHQKMDFRPDAEDIVVLPLLEGDETKKNPDALWRIGRFYHNLAEMNDDSKKYPKKKVQEWYELGHKHCKASVELSPEDSYAQSWFAFTLMGTMKELGPKDKVKSMPVIKEALKKAIELDSNNWHAHLMKGVMAYEVTQLPWIARQAAEVFLGAPPAETFEDALASLRRCLECITIPEDHPMRLFVYTSLAGTLFHMKGEPGTGHGNGKSKDENRREAKVFIDRALQVPLKGSISLANVIEEKTKPVLKKIQSKLG